MKLLTTSSIFLLASLAHVAHSIEAQTPLHNSPTSDSSSTSALLSLHKSLITCESISGNEYDVGKVLAKYLRSKNFTVEVQEVVPATKSSPARNNIFAYVGKSRKTRTLISSHIDTVPPFWKYERKAEEIWGRGSVDAKGSIATQVIAVEELLVAGKIEEGDVGLLYVVGEEVGGEGMRKANDLGLDWETVIFGEPTELKLASGHKGTMGAKLKAKGKAGHSGYPELGKSANAMLIEALHALLQAEFPSSEKYGNTTLNIGTIKGGVAGNVIAEDAEAEITFRIADGTPEVIQKIVLDTIAQLEEPVDTDFRGGGYGPVYIDSDVPRFEKIVVNYGTDIPNLEGDHKRYLYGPGSILMAHSDHEHLKVSDLEEAVQGYKALIKHSLK